MIRVLVADDQELVREGLALIIGAQPDIEVVGEAADGVDAVAMAKTLRPDVVLMDIRMPKIDGIDATRLVLAAVPDCHVLVLTTFDLDEAVIAALRAGASGFLLKDTPRRSLVAAIRAVAEGEVLLDAEVAQRLLADHLPASHSKDASAVLELLTPRETEVFKALARGLSNAEVGRDLGMGEATVKTHVAKLLEKLAVRDRVQLVVLAHTAGVFGS
ncbi:MAG: response regulator transcription factor [Actinomycetes bacterium]